MGFRSVSVISILLAALLASSVAVAQERGRYYRWIDNDGQIHYGRTLPPEYADLPYQKLNEAGIVVDSQRGALTDEELEAMAAEEIRAAEEQKLADIRDRQNRSLMVKYPTMQSLEDALTFNLERVGSDIMIARSMFDTQVENLMKEVSRAADFQRTGIPVGATLQTTISGMRIEIASAQGKVDELQVSLESVKNNHAREKNRYLGIKGKRG